LLKLILPEPKESSETEVMRHEGRIIQLTSPHISSPHTLRGHSWLWGVSVRTGRARRERNRTPRMGQQLPTLRDRGSSGPRMPAGSLSRPGHRRAVPGPGCPWLLRGSPLALFLANNPSPKPPGTELRDGGCPVWAQRRAQLFCSSPGIVHRSRSDRAFSKH